MSVILCIICFFYRLLFVSGVVNKKVVDSSYCVMFTYSIKL